MKKIWEWLTGSVIKEVGDVIDKLTTTKEEKLEAQRLITEILEKADKLKSKSQRGGKQTWLLIAFYQKIYDQWFLYI